VSGVLGATGLVVAASTAAAAILLPAGRLRAAAMLVALALFPALILGDQWHSPQIAALRDDTMRIAGLATFALATSAALAAAFLRWPLLLPLAIVAALPFRIPLESGGDTANLLVPLYLVIAGGILASAIASWTRLPAGWAPPTRASRAATWLPRVLAAVVVLYALQALYSPDFSKSLQSVCFFFVPFGLVYALLRDVDWDRRLLRLVLWLVAIEAVAFVAVGTVEYASQSLFWNDLVIRSNEFHTYFRVNSIFWDPNIYGRYLALAATIAMAVLLWTRGRRPFELLTGLVAILWIGLVPTFSQSSFAALLAGLAILAALKWSRRWTLAAVAAGVVAAALVVTLVGGSKVNLSRINIDTSGRANLVSGGLHLFAQRPVHGYGSGSFPKAYREHVRTREVPVSVSHTEPITVAAEQGLVGLAAYAALIAVALWTMGTGLMWRWPAGPVAAGDPPPPGVAEASSGAVPPATPPAGRTGTSADASPAGGGGVGWSRRQDPRAAAAGRIAVLAAFVALLVHTMAYAGFYEDPIAWVLLAVGASLAGATVRDAT
jgi:putative inorganic carbon (HCO3(-)) transporter